MALQTKTISANGSKGHHKFTLTVTENSTSISDNTSSLSFTFKISSLGGNYDWYYWGQQISYSVNINGSVYSGYIPDYDGVSTVTLKSGSLSASHNADGSKSINISFSVTDSTGQTYTSGNASSSASMTLTTIPRASSVSGGSGNIGSATTINISRASNSFTHTLEYAFGSLTGTIATGVATSYQWTIPTSFYGQIPNANSGTGTITCKTYNGSTLVGTKTISFTAKVVNSNPTFSANNLSYADTNATVTAITGNNQHIVQNQSNLKVTYTSATAKNSATIKEYTFTLNGVTKTSTSAGGTLDFGKINSANNLTLSVKVKDSRGNTTTATKTITMLAHKNPTAIVTLNRLNNYEDETYLTVDGAISSVNNKNAMTIKYRYKISGGSYGSFTTIGDNVKQTLSLNKNNAYIFNIVITDSFGTTYDKEHPLGKGVFPFFIDTEKNSLGMNTFPRAERVFEMGGRIVESDKEFSIPTTIGAKTGWYLAMSGEFSYVTNKAFLISIQQTFSGGVGLLYFNMRYFDNALTIQRCEWVTHSGISSENIKLKIEGNKFYLYLKTTANYQQYYVKVIQEKILGGWNFNQYTMHSPTLDDTVEEPEGKNPSGFVDKIYPVGSIYMSVNSTNPSTIFGGTWEQLKDRFLLGAGNTYSNGSTGGSATHTLTVDEIPAHSHRNAHYVVGSNAPSYGGWEDTIASGNSGSSYKASANSNETGGGKAHNNMPPYLTVYMWKRTG